MQLKSAAKWFVVVDGSSGPEFDRISTNGVTFGGDSGRFAYFGRTGEKWLAVIDGRPGPNLMCIAGSTLGFSSDGRRLAYAAQKRHALVVVTDR